MIRSSTKVTLGKREKCPQLEWQFLQEWFIFLLTKSSNYVVLWSSVRQQWSSRKKLNPSKELWLRFKLLLLICPCRPFCSLPRKLFRAACFSSLPTDEKRAPLKTSAWETSPSQPLVPLASTIKPYYNYNWSFLLGYLRDRPRSEDSKPDKPIKFPFESTSMYDQSATSLEPPSLFICHQ